MKELQQPLEIASATLLESNNNTNKYIKPTDKYKKDVNILPWSLIVEGEGAYVNSIILTELMTKTPFFVCPRK